ncbi:MAG: hypothetical protein Q7T18_12420 [Sedimentisphaerales bacterium]|nr:hypothetical protein [Sedimentisphaerales bacterium]
MNKKMILLIAGAGIVCTATGFLFAWLGRPHPVIQAEPNATAQTSAPIVTDLANIHSGAYMNTDVNNAAFRKTMTEKQLKLLVQNMRAKMVDVEQKEQDLAVRSEQINTTRESLQKDINDLNSLRVELAAAAAAVRQEREKLETLRLKITQDEMTNLKKTAGIYDKMDATNGSKILIRMCGSKQTDDVVKIINYMTERTAAKMLAEIGSGDPNTAAILCEKLKIVKEEK